MSEMVKMDKQVKALSEVIDTIEWAKNHGYTGADKAMQQFSDFLKIDCTWEYRNRRFVFWIPA